jgi:tetratricopeptide (TPR) repeat protein
MARILLLMGAATLAFFAHGEGERAGDAQNAGRDPDELMYLPEGRYLEMASLGHRNFMADLIWLRAIQYYGEQRLTTRNYDEAERLFQVIYDLDSSFKGATRFGALVLAQDARNPDGGLALLHRAERDDPLAWEYPFDQGFILHTVKKEYEGAGNAYRRAAGLPGAPPVAGRLAGLSLAKLGDRSAARDVWQSIAAEDENDLMRDVARRNLRNLDLEDAEETMTRALAAFRERTGRDPKDWNELVSAIDLVRIPVAPYGGRFYYDEATDEVLSTTTVDRRMAQLRDIFRGYVQAYAKQHGTFPPLLDALVEAGIARYPAWKPMGVALDYDAKNGTIRWNPPWHATEARTHGDGLE